MSDQENQTKEKNIILEDEKALLLNHDYDGIQELNHPLPFWWIWIFVLTILFSVPYFIYYHVSNGPSLKMELDQRMAQINLVREVEAKKQGGFDLNAYSTYVTTEESKELAAKTYKRRCRSCHGENGEGGIGPNLTDKFWIHGNGSPGTIYQVVDKGVDANGMPAWGEILDKETMYAVTAYIISLKGTEPENAKAAQGTEIP